MAKVTVICMAYNHENFIRQTLDGFINQKVDFDVEYIIHDDASTDGTRSIIEEYHSNYPNIIKPIFEVENQYQRPGVPVSIEIQNASNSEYIALCEGDDYWIDDYKLKKQIEYMDKNPQCSLTIHNAFILDNVSKKRKKINPYPHAGIIPIRELLNERKGCLPPTASMVFRTEIIQKMPLEIFRSPVGDRNRRMYLATKGYVYYFDDVMSVYRTNNSQSFDGRLQDYNTSLSMAKSMEEFYIRFNNYTNHEYDNEVKMLIAFEYYAHHSRFNEIEAIRENIYYKEKTSIFNKIKTEVKAFLPKSVISLLKKINSKL